MIRLSVMLSNLDLPPEEGLRVAGELGLDGVQLSVAQGPWAPEALKDNARKHWKEEIARLGLEVTAVGAGGPGFPYADRERLDGLLVRAREIARLAAEFGAPVWQSHIGRVPENPGDPVRVAMAAAISRVAQIAYDHGVWFAIETGPESPFVLKSFIEQVGSPGVKVNYDPANFVIWPAILAKEQGETYSERDAMESFIPTEGVNLLAPYIVHVHAKDAVVTPDGESHEVPLGEGWVRWNRFVDLLQTHGFDGFMAIERESREDRIGQVQQAISFLRGLEHVSPPLRRGPKTA